jgi:hypothetical protein
LSLRVALAALALLLLACASPAPLVTERCPSCHEPLTGAKIEFDARFYHPACYERAGPRCDLCGASIATARYVAFGPGHEYHETCWTASPRCEVCGFPAGERGHAVPLDDGRRTCADCRLTAVNDSAEAAAALLEARGLLARELGLTLGPITVPVALVSRQKLLEEAADVGKPAIQALTVAREDAPSANGGRGARSYRVIALYGIPRAALVAILGHELFHVLQCEASPAERDPAFREGAADYVHVVLLRAQGEEGRARLLESVTDTVYGEGLRRFERLARARGRKEALALALGSTAFPDGF